MMGDVAQFKTLRFGGLASFLRVAVVQPRSSDLVGLLYQNNEKIMTGQDMSRRHAFPEPADPRLV